MEDKCYSVVDASGLVAGRLASLVAKRLLRGERIIIVNAEKAIITGKRQRVVEWYMKRVSEWRTHYNPERKGPKIPRRPDLMLKRMVKNMLPYKKPRGREALKRLRVYMGVPQEYANVDKLVPKEAALQNEKVQYVTLAELSKLVGGSHG
ncbi:MAG: 50S ribosomal protein L13 [Thermofilaceae archaeon]|nr:50S ribosomal protein L13 [Thermofilaceae archaeon]MCX8181081.1 50S ribosomal protein L13 [Thermofilaceae archaeon]MDW8004562.1 50S ribosomal protein L13 [Thermofilaceae archaeon]